MRWISRTLLPVVFGAGLLVIGGCGPDNDAQLKKDAAANTGKAAGGPVMNAPDQRAYFEQNQKAQGTSKGANYPGAK